LAEPLSLDGAPLFDLAPLPLETGGLARLSERLLAPLPSLRATSEPKGPSYEDWRRAEKASDDLRSIIKAAEDPTVVGIRVAQDGKALILAVETLGGARPAALPQSYQGLPTEVRSSLADNAETRAGVQEAKAYTRHSKGRPYSASEYNLSLYYKKLSLEERKVSPEFLQAFDAAEALAPVIGGSFNPWAGD